MKFEVLDNIFARSRDSGELWESISAVDSESAVSKFCARMDKETQEAWTSKTILVRNSGIVRKFTVKRSYTVTLVDAK